MPEIHCIEEWRPVVGYEFEFSVSSNGRIRRESGRFPSAIGRIIKGTKHRVKQDKPNNHYIRVSFRRWHRRFMHVVVAEAFIGPCPFGKSINHKNGNKMDNRIENLEYITFSENVAHAWRTGLIPRKGVPQ